MQGQPGLHSEVLFEKKSDLEKDNQKKKITVYPSVLIWLGCGKDPPGLCSQEASGEASGCSGLLPGGLGPSGLCSQQTSGHPELCS